MTMMRSRLFILPIAHYLWNKKGHEMVGKKNCQMSPAVIEKVYRDTVLWEDIYQVACKKLFVTSICLYITSLIQISLPSCLPADILWLQFTDLQLLVEWFIACRTMILIIVVKDMHVIQLYYHSSYRWRDSIGPRLIQSFRLRRRRQSYICRKVGKNFIDWSQKLKIWSKPKRDNESLIIIWWPAVKTFWVEKNFTHFHKVSI